MTSRSGTSDQQRGRPAPWRAVFGVALVLVAAAFLFGLYLQTGRSDTGFAALAFAGIGALVAYRKIYLGIIVPSKGEGQS